MTWQWLALGALALVALFLGWALARLRSRTRRDLAAARAEADVLRERLDRLEQGGQQRRTPEPSLPTEEHEFTITGLGEPEPGQQDQPRRPVQLEHRVFADVLLRESVIRIGSLTHGVRRALSAESRNRIRFEMRREVKRARKQRRVEQREAYREWQQRQRDSRKDNHQDVA